jgi:hypothetical protein
MFLVRVQMNTLGEALEADEAQVRLLPTVNQLMPLQFTRSGEPLVAKLTGIFFLKLFLQHRQLLASKTGY